MIDVVLVAGITGVTIGALALGVGAPAVLRNRATRPGDALGWPTNTPRVYRGDDIDTPGDPWRGQL